MAWKKLTFEEDINNAISTHAALPNAHHNEDHAVRHLAGGSDALSVGAPVAIGAANAEGSQTNFARRDHVHEHGSTVRCGGDFSGIDMRIRCRTSDPGTPSDGEMWLRTDL